MAMNRTEKIRLIDRVMDRVASNIKGLYYGMKFVNDCITDSINHNTTVKCEIFSPVEISLLAEAKLTLDDLKAAKDKRHQNKAIIQGQLNRLIDAEKMLVYGAAATLDDYFRHGNKEHFSLKDIHELQQAEIFERLDLPYVLETERLAAASSMLALTTLGAAKSFEIISNLSNEQSKDIFLKLFKHRIAIIKKSLLDELNESPDIDAVVKNIKNAISAGQRKDLDADYLDYIYTPAYKKDIELTIQNMILGKKINDIVFDFSAATLTQVPAITAYIIAIFITWSECMVGHSCPEVIAKPFKLQPANATTTAFIMSQVINHTDPKVQGMLNVTQTLMVRQKLSMAQVINDAQEFSKNKSDAFPHSKTYKPYFENFSPDKTEIETMFTPELKAQILAITEARILHQDMHMAINSFKDSMYLESLSNRRNITERFKNWNDCYIHDVCPNDAPLSSFWKSPVTPLNFTARAPAALSSVPIHVESNNANWLNPANNFRIDFASRSSPTEMALLGVTAVGIAATVLAGSRFFYQGWKKRLSRSVKTESLAATGEELQVLIKR